jgi:putative oxidoreductase
MYAIATLVGRLCLAAIFIVSGISKIGAYATTVSYMQARGVPLATVAFYLSVLLEIVAGLSLATGYRARIAALVLFGFLIPVTYLFHFKPAFDAAMNVVDRNQMTMVMKNLAIMGGLLMIWGNGAGSFTIGRDS